MKGGTCKCVALLCLGAGAFGYPLRLLRPSSPPRKLGTIAAVPESGPGLNVPVHIGHVCSSCARQCMIVWSLQQRLQSRSVWAASEPLPQWGLDLST
eukprot:5361100-Alexandrium_andersonii.AAC.1